MKERILVTGKNGQLGFELQRSLGLFSNDGIEVIAVGTSDCNLAEVDAVRTLIREIRPRVIVNAAAYTAVDKAESEPELAMAVNGVAPGVLGEEAARIGAWVVHYSTDYVFDGKSQQPYREDDATNPLSVYGRSKRAGEVALQESGAQHLILRTSWVLGAHGGNFAKTILRLAAERESLNVVADQFGAPTSTALLADATAQLIRQAYTDGETNFSFGLYHLAASGETHWCDYARFVVGEALAAGAKLKLQPDAINPITTADYPLPAPRPANSRLNTEKFRHAFGMPLPHWQDGVRQVIRQVLST
ncbi:MAG TPA: dTDP-4-dehydrorhamnose reductase [Rhodocyclaceae bacterium]|jgi:dTDP-4-dehydrorhamnose reductase|nr:dTDP-4-dehydrorhamnose reductase [Rhodocyclaceae bacterium]